MRIATASARTGFAMTRFLQGVQWAGDRKGRPYGSATWSAEGLQGVRYGGPMYRHRPLRKRILVCALAWQGQL